MKVQKYHIYVANLNPQSYKEEPGKERPVVVIQSDLLNKYHSSTVVCPLTTQVIDKPLPIRVQIRKSTLNRLSEHSAILVDQIRSVSNQRLVRHLGELTAQERQELVSKLQDLLIEDWI